MPPLRLDPIEQGTITRIVRGDVQIPILGFEEDQLIEHRVPGFLTATEIFSAGGEGVDEGVPFSCLVRIGGAFFSISNCFGAVVLIVAFVLLFVHVCVIHRWKGGRAFVCFFGGGNIIITAPSIVNCNYIVFFGPPFSSTSWSFPSRSCLGSGLLCCSCTSNIRCGRTGEQQKNLL